MILAVMVRWEVEVEVVVVGDVAMVLVVVVRWHSVRLVPIVGWELVK